MATDTIKKVSNDSENNYCKMPDGTLIQWGNTSLATAASSRESIALNFQLAFIDTPRVVASPSNSTRPDLYFANIRSIASDHFTLYVYNGYSSQISIPVDWIAIGRWK